MAEHIVDPIAPSSMEASYHLQGDFDQRKTCYGESYYRLRGIWLDCRGTLQVMRDANLEWGVRIITLSHPNDQPSRGPNIDRPVIIEPKAWICSFATLYNCHIGEGAVVALGSVVRSQDVPPWTMVAGNPAQIIAKFDHENEKWVYLDRPEKLSRVSCDPAARRLRKEIKERAPELSYDSCTSSERTWREHVNEIRRLILEDDPAHFLSWPVIISTMAGIGREDWAIALRQYLEGLPDWEERWKDAIGASPVGGPPRYFGNSPKTTMAAMTAAVSLAQFEQSTGKKVSELPFVFEFGGGYGRLRHLLDDLGFKGVYLDYDFPMMVALKRYYLMEVGVYEPESNLLLSDLGELTKVLKDAPKGSLFVSNWALSETSLALREKILSLIRDLGYFLVVYQPEFGEVDNERFFSEMQSDFHDVHWQRGAVPGPRSTILTGTKTTGLYAQFAGEGDLFFDIGAYVGEKTQVMLGLGASKIIAVEPQPDSFALLRERFADNPRVEIIQKGIAANPGVMTMFYDEEMRKTGSLTVATFSERYTKEGRFSAFTYADRLEAEMTTLDALIAQYGFPAFCKIDVEGFERQVLTGLSQPLPALCYEYAIEFEDEALACAKLLQALGNYEFNFAEGQNEEFAFPEWTTDEEEFFDRVRQVPCTDWKGLLWGDVYARLRVDD